MQPVGHLAQGVELNNPDAVELDSLRKVSDRLHQSGEPAIRRDIGGTFTDLVAARTSPVEVAEGSIDSARPMECRCGPGA